MPSDFWAGYASGVAGITVGNPLDVVKVRLQASYDPSTPVPASASLRLRSLRDAKTLLSGLPAPVLTYGALNAILFASYNRSLSALGSSFGAADAPPRPWMQFSAGVIGGLVTFVVSAPTELIKCRAQVVRGDAGNPSPTSAGNSWEITKQILRQKGIPGMYHGGVVTSIRDAVGYGFYFWTYEVTKSAWERRRVASSDGGREKKVSTASGDAVMILVCGGIAGVATWTSVFPLDVIKTRVQTESAMAELAKGQPLAQSSNERPALVPQKTLGAWSTARHMWKTQGFHVFWRGLTICCVRAFIVNAVQWTVYEWMMR